MSTQLDQIAALTDAQQRVYREAREAGATVDSAIAQALQFARRHDLPGYEKPGHWFDTNRNGFNDGNE